MKKVLAVFLVVVALAALGCAQKKAVQPEAAPAEPMAKAPEMPAQEMAPQPRESEMMGQEMAKVEAEALTPKKGAPSFDDIRFDFDKYDIREDAKPVLKSLAAWLVENRAGVVVEGHCDDRGTNEYNLALGDRRANSVKKFLVASGVPANRIETVSYGEERPLCDAKNEACWSRNRRAHFVIAD
ncbi:MAG: hypothetical protein Kow0025_01570 [Thermodesulfovibrionales bacterium]